MAKKKGKVAELNLVRYKVDFLMSKMADYNPRDINGEQKAGLSYSIENYGYMENIVYNKKTETIVSGHQRITILSEQGYDEVDVHEINVSLEVEKELNVTMNNTKIQGSFTSALEDLLNDISESNPELYDLTNMSRLSFSDLVDDSDDEVEDTVKAKAVGDDIPEMELMPYEHYDCVLVVFKRTDDFVYMQGKLGLNEKRVISAPMVKNKKVGTVRAIDGSKLIALVDGTDLEGKL